MHRPINLASGRWSVGLGLLSCVTALGGAAPAVALEQDPMYAHGPYTPFYFPGQDAATERTLGLPPTAADGGVDVLGDSISFGVPYVERAAEDGVSASVRSVSGWTVRLHRRVTGWIDTPATSVQTVMAGDAAAVIVELGTNDLRCLRPSDACPDTPAADAPGAEAFVDAGRAAIADEVTGLATELLAAGKCVIWVSPRMAPPRDARDLAFFHRLLDAQRNAHPGRFSRIDLANDPVVAADLAAPGSDGVHPRSRAARDAIADLLVTTAEHRCAVRSAGPRVTIDAGPPAAGADRTPSVAFSARQARTTFRCRVDRGPDFPCTSPLELPPQADGAHRFTVAGTNAARGHDAGPAARSFVVDTAAPVLDIGPAVIRVGRRGGGQLLLRCTDAGGSCTGTVRVRVSTLGTRWHHDRRTLATIRFTARAGRRRHIPFTVAQPTLSALRRRGTASVTAVVQATDSVGNRGTATGSLLMVTTSR